MSSASGGPPATTRRASQSASGSRIGVSPAVIATLLCGCRRRGPRQHDPIAEFAGPDRPAAQGSEHPAGFLGLVALFAIGYAVTNALVAWMDDANAVFCPNCRRPRACARVLLAAARRSRAARHRLPQTVIAVFGVYMLLAPAVAALLLMRGPSEVEPCDFAPDDCRLHPDHDLVPPDRRAHPQGRARHRARNGLRDRDHLAAREHCRRAIPLWLGDLMHVHILGICGTFMGGIAVARARRGPSRHGLRRKRLSADEHAARGPGHRADRRLRSRTARPEARHRARRQRHEPRQSADRAAARQRPAIQLGAAVVCGEHAARPRGRGGRRHARQDDDVLDARVDTPRCRTRTRVPDRRHSRELRRLGARGRRPRPSSSRPTNTTRPSSTSARSSCTTVRGTCC